jgi:regulatory protein
LRHRDRSAAEVDRYLEGRGVTEIDRREVVDTLVRTSLIDDRRYAATRATALAERGAGNDLIRHELSRAGIDVDSASAAIEALAAETERAGLVVARRGASAKTARYLAGKGFSADVVHDVVAQSRDQSLG